MEIRYQHGVADRSNKADKLHRLVVQTKALKSDEDLRSDKESCSATCISQVLHIKVTP